MKQSRFSDKAMARILKTFADHLTCWRVKPIIGSMTDFDMGQKCLQRLPHGRSVEVGTAALTLQSDAWVIKKGRSTIADSISFSEAIVGNLSRVFVGEKLLSVAFDKDSKACHVRFSNDLHIALPAGPDDDDLISLALPDGTLIACDSLRGFVSDGSRSEARAAAYAADITR